MLHLHAYRFEDRRRKEETFETGVYSHDELLDPIPDFKSQAIELRAPRDQDHVAVDRVREGAEKGRQGVIAVDGVVRPLRGTGATDQRKEEG